jgi:hypothetical protein
MLRRYKDPLARPVPGAELKSLRIQAEISIEDFARVYGHGRPVSRIEELESSPMVHGNIARCYKLVVRTFLTMRSSAAKRDVRMDRGDA